MNKQSLVGDSHTTIPAAWTERTFAVTDVVPATEALPIVPYHQAVADFLGGQIESCSQYHGQLVAFFGGHPLIGALHAAFASHRPIRLSPDIVWLTLTQGLAHHINANAEQLRHHFVQHEGKLKITVRRDDFVKGSPENPWPEVFSEFSETIRDHIGDAHALIVADFTTTGPVERAASEIVLMDAMQSFFSYDFVTLCGIPSMTLEGTAEDWRKIAGRVREFSRFDLGWWVESLEPVLEQFVAAAEGRVDRRFWGSIYKWHDNQESGGSPHVSGWIQKLFPYLNSRPTEGHYSGGKISQTHCRNPWIETPPSRGEGPDPDRIPRLPARAPFRWNHLGTEYDMEFIGGLIGIRQDTRTLCLRPEIGWVVWEAGAEQRKSQADAEARWAAREIEERVWAEERAQARARTEVVAPRLDPDRPRHAQFFEFVCRDCHLREEIGLWFTYKTCSGCQKGWRIVRPAEDAK